MKPAGRGFWYDPVVSLPAKTGIPHVAHVDRDPRVYKLVKFDGPSNRYWRRPGRNDGNVINGTLLRKSPETQIPGLCAK